MLFNLICTISGIDFLLIGNTKRDGQQDNKENFSITCTCWANSSNGRTQEPSADVPMGAEKDNNVLNHCEEYFYFMCLPDLESCTYPKLFSNYATLSILGAFRFSTFFCW